MAGEPRTNTEMIAPDQQDKGDEGTHYGEINHRVAINGKAPVIEHERMQKLIPPAQDGKEMHHRKAAIGKDAEYAQSHAKAQNDLCAAHGIDLHHAHIHIIKMAGKKLILPRRDDLMRGPQEDEPREPQPQDQKGGGIKPVLRRKF